MEFCPNCGSKIIGNSKFCGECGYDLVNLPTEAKLLNNEEELQKREEIKRLEEQKALEAKKKAEEERIAKEKEEQKRLEEERIAKEKAELERLEKERLELEKKTLEEKKKQEELKTKLEQTKKEQASIVFNNKYAKFLKIFFPVAGFISIGLAIVAIFLATLLKDNHYYIRDTQRLLIMIFASVSTLLGIACLVLAILSLRGSKKNILSIVGLNIGVVSLVMGLVAVPIDVYNPKYSNPYISASNISINITPRSEYGMYEHLYIKNWDTIEGKKPHNYIWATAIIGNVKSSTNWSFDFEPRSDYGYVQFFLTKTNYEEGNKAYINEANSYAYSDPFLWADSLTTPLTNEGQSFEYGDLDISKIVWHTNNN